MYQKSEINYSSPVVAHKSLNLSFTQCNEGLLKYAGLQSEEQIIGLTDYDLPWQMYADIYHKHELDALEGKHYSAIVPIIDHQKNEHIILHSKFQKIDDKGHIVGTVTHAIEVINPHMIELNYLMNATAVDHSTSNYFPIRDSFLSNRENECLFYLLRGKSAKQIAKILTLSPKTVEHYIENVKLKFNCQTKSDLINEAIEKGFMNVIPKSIFSEKLNTILKECASNH